MPRPTKWQLWALADLDNCISCCLKNIKRRLTKMQIFVLFLSILFAGLTSGCQSSTPLNSERIADQYGSYGVEIMRASNALRVTNLYSGTAVDKTMRTLAIVEFVAADDPRIATEHATIVAGGSIGAVFKQHGWQIHKDIIEMCEQEFSDDSLPLLAQMHTSLPQIFAVYRYQFRIAKSDDSIGYALITEIYHPDYLSFEQLIGHNKELTPEPAQTNCSSSVSRLLTVLR
jgi:hypothetical protein